MKILLARLLAPLTAMRSTFKRFRVHIPMTIAVRCAANWPIITVWRPEAGAGHRRNQQHCWGLLCQTLLAPGLNAGLTTWQQSADQRFAGNYWEDGFESLELHTKYSSLDDDSYWKNSALVGASNGQRVGLSTWRGQEDNTCPAGLKSSPSAPKSGDTQFSDSLELMAFLANLGGIRTHRALSFRWAEARNERRPGPRRRRGMALDDTSQAGRPSPSPPPREMPKFSGTKRAPPSAGTAQSPRRNERKPAGHPQARAPRGPAPRARAPRRPVRPAAEKKKKKPARSRPERTGPSDAGQGAGDRRRGFAWYNGARKMVSSLPELIAPHGRPSRPARCKTEYSRKINWRLKRRPGNT